MSCHEATLLGTGCFRTSRCCRTPRNSSGDQGRSEGPMEHIQPGLNDISLVLGPLHQHPGIDDVDADDWQYQRSRRRPGDPSANLIDPTGQEQRRDTYRTSGSLSISPSFPASAPAPSRAPQISAKTSSVFMPKMPSCSWLSPSCSAWSSGRSSELFITRPFWGARL